MPAPTTSVPAAILDRIQTPAVPRVWGQHDFADLGSRYSVDQALHRLMAANKIRRIAHGLYDVPTVNRLTGKPTYPDPRDVIDALARKGNVRIVVDGITAANDLGLTDAVPAHVTVLTDGRLRPISLGNLKIDFQYAAPSRLYWAGRPAMRLVQALHWVRDMLPTDNGSIHNRLVNILQDPDHGQAIQNDLHDGFHALPDWMQSLIRELLQEANNSRQKPSTRKKASSGRTPKRAAYHEKAEASSTR